jgi:hypothetical protein
MGIVGELGEPKGRWPKSERKRAIRRRNLKAAAEYKKAIERRDGSSGAASPCKRIDPKTGEVIEVLNRPPNLGQGRET